MISERTAKFIKNVMPKPVLRQVTKIVIGKYMSKYASVTVCNSENLSRVKGPVIFICNHLSNSDGLVLHDVLKDLDVTFVAGVKLSQNVVTSLALEYINIIPINPNSADKAAITATVKLLKSGKSILIFPEGTRSRTGSLIKARRGVLLLAKLTGVPIVPLGIEGTEKLLPINDGDMGKESFHQADVKVTIGEEFNLPEKMEDEDRRSYEERAIHYVMRKIAVLLPEKYQGVYKE